jgi:hypothetical protein
MAFIKFNNGLNTAGERSYIDPGEMINATGGYYKPGDTERLWKITGRTLYADAYAGAYRAVGISYCAFDTAETDKIVVANTNGEYHMSTVTSGDATAGSFATLTTGLTTGADFLCSVHFQNDWYIGDNKNFPNVLQPDNTFRRMGLRRPLGSVSASTVSGTTLERVTTATYTGSDWADVSLAYDTVAESGNYADYFRPDTNTYAVSEWGEDDSNGDSRAIIFSGFGADTGTDRVLRIVLGVYKANETGWSAGLTWLDWWKTLNNAGFDFSVKVEVSDDNQVSWTAGTSTYTINGENGGAWFSTREIAFDITDSDQISDYAVRVTVTNNMETGELSTTDFRIYDVMIANYSWLTAQDTTSGLQYAVCEGIEADGVIGPPVFSNNITFTGATGVSLTMPRPRNAGRFGSNTNTAATHWYIFRNWDGGGSALQSYRLLTTVPISQTRYTDIFTGPINSPNIGAQQLPIAQVAGTWELYNDPPPQLKVITEFDRYLVGLSDTAPRALFYSLPNSPEYWPWYHVVTEFPLAEHDSLKALGVAGDFLIVGAQANLIVIAGLPDSDDLSSLVKTRPTILKGAPGCVGPYAMKSYSLGGETRCVWVSEQGVYETNGHQVWELSTKLDWANTVNQGTLSRTWLHWDKDDQVMEMGVDSTGDGYPDVSYYFHMAADQKFQGLPKITGPHDMGLRQKVSAQAVDGRYRAYSVQAAAGGEVYHEKDGTTDAGSFFNTLSQVNFDVTSGRLYGPQMREWSVTFPTVQHNSWNSSPLVGTWTTGRDHEVEESENITVTMTFSGQGRNRIGVARSGEWHQVRLVNTGDAGASAAIGAIETDEEITAETGNA